LVAASALWLSLKMLCKGTWVSWSYNNVSGWITDDLYFVG
jgi:hypothetical protein